MTRRPGFVLTIGCALALLGAAPVLAQTTTGTTGAINGRVLDSTKAVLPGVTVTISSPSMMGTRSDTTKESGDYRFSAIPPGEYRLVFELPGFATVNREGIRVTLGFTATVDVEMQLAGQQESITVTGESPVVDKQTMKIATTFEAAQMAELPNARDFAALVAATPGAYVTLVDVGGSNFGTVNNYVLYGVASGQDRPMVEGMVAAEETGNLYYTDYGSFAEVSIGTAASSAETGQPGLFQQFIVKSGGNSYRGSIYGDYENGSMQAHNIDAAQLATGISGGSAMAATDINRTTKFHDFNADVGGFLVRDKWWWYGSFRETVNLIAKPTLLSEPQLTTLLNRTLKMTYNLSDTQKLIGFINHNNKILPNDFSGYLLNRINTINPSSLSLWDEKFPVGVWKGEYNATPNNNSFLEVRAGQYFYNWDRYPKSPISNRYEDAATNWTTGTPARIFLRRRRTQLMGSYSYFKSGLAGTHNFKFGADFMHETSVNAEKALPGGILHVLRNGAPYQVRLYAMPNDSLGGLRTYSAYASDIWQVNNRLTFNLGLRYDRYRSFLPAQVHPASTWDPTTTQFPAVDNVATFPIVGPRLGMSYDVSGNGKTVIKGQFGLYSDSPGCAYFFNPNSSQWYKTYSWNDLNKDGIFEDGEQGLQVDSAGGPTQQLDSNLKMRWTRDFAGWFEHELMPNFGIRTGFVWRKMGDPRMTINANRPYDAFTVPVTIADPGPDGRVGSADDGPAIAAFNIDAAHATLTPFNLMTNIRGDRSDYYTWENTATKRMSGHWSLAASFTYTWSRAGLGAFTSGQVYNPDAFIFAASDGRRHFTNWQSKITSTFELPHDLRVTPLLRLESGVPFGRQVVAAFNFGSQTILSEPWNARRLPNIYIVDIRTEKGFRFKGRRVAAFLDAFNLLNANPVTNAVQTSGSAFLRPITIVSPRIFRVGGKFEW